MARVRAGKNKAVDRVRWPYRMKDLCELTDLDRQTVHFYIAKGLVPEGHKINANMAYYGAEHLERLNLVLELKNQRFLPLDAIRAVLDGQDHAFTPEQRALLVEVKDRVADVLQSGRGSGTTVAAASLLRKHKLTRAELTKLAQLGVVATVQVRGVLHLVEDDVWVVELWASLREAGYSRALGFGVEDLAVYIEAIDRLFEREVRELTPRFSKLPADSVVELFRRGLPIINSFLARYHQAKARAFFARF
jgi:DNA-binding transcriptional MerR regulator